MFDSQEPYFDWITPIGNALIGILQILITGVASFLLQGMGFPMFNFFAPWFPLIIGAAFFFGVASFKRSPKNIWALAFEMNILALLIGIWVHFFWIGMCMTIPATAGGVAFGRKMFKLIDPPER